VAEPLGAIWILPFAGLLLSIAVFPLAAPHFWHQHYGKVAAFWALAYLIPSAVLGGIGHALHDVSHALILEYIPFIALVSSLFIICGGVRIVGGITGTPAQNTALLAFGAALASLIGTTGAAILLIQPLLAANAWRTRRTHLVIFFIILIGNIGGALTPIGDPPLFVGFLLGVGFFWPTVNLLGPMLLCAVPLLAIFYLVDRRYAAREAGSPPAKAEPLRIEGRINLLLVLGVVGAVLVSGLWKPGVAFTVLGTPVAGENLARTLFLILMAALSLALTPRALRIANEFNWEPILEVAKLFIAIFLTIIPVLAIIHAGSNGVAAPMIAALSQDGQPIPAIYFWVTGALSAFLDNAPTYLVMFTLAGGDPEVLTGALSKTLLAISAGSVFMGALTYIGNAPNFIIKAVAENRGVTMPSFFGYFGLACLLLLPLFGLVTLVYF
jgi:Na+/H+ antiporter NhaD/arsenite permease-like protein